MWKWIQLKWEIKLPEYVEIGLRLRLGLGLLLGLVLLLDPTLPHLAVAISNVFNSKYRLSRDSTACGMCHCFAGCFNTKTVLTLVSCRDVNLQEIISRIEYFCSWVLDRVSNHQFQKCIGGLKSSRACLHVSLFCWLFQYSEWLACSEASFVVHVPFLDYLRSRFSCTSNFFGDSSQSRLVNITSGTQRLTLHWVSMTSVDGGEESWVIAWKSSVRCAQCT